MENKSSIKIAKHLKKYSPEDGASSGKRFYHELLRPQFEDARKANRILLINLDGLREWPSSFVKASFGKLAKDFGPKNVLNHVEFQSKDNPVRKEKVKYVIRNSGQDKSFIRS